MSDQTLMRLGTQKAPSSSASVLLEVRDLRLYFRTTKGVVQAVDGVSFSLERRRSLAILGESGCGKTSLARAILRLLPRNVHTFSGEIVPVSYTHLTLPTNREV